MDYQISEKVKNALDILTADDRVQAALKFIEEDQEEIISRQMELALIPSPSHHEEKKGARLLQMFEAEGLSDCRTDEIGNSIGIRKGTGGGNTILMEGHLDTVFPLDTELTMIRENGYIRCPGIVDDTRGCVTLLSVMRALNAAGIETKGDIQFAGTVLEEGSGGLAGMKHYVGSHPELKASISIDGPGYGAPTYQATGIKTIEFTFHGAAGHSFMAFGEISNTIHAAARAIARISGIRVPAIPRTTYAVTNFHAGTLPGVHAIPDTASFIINFRSNSPEELDKLKGQIFDAVEAGCREESEFWGKNTVTYEYRYICDVDAKLQDPHAPIVEAAVAASLYLGSESADLPVGGCTNCNMALLAGLPAVCLGEGADYDPMVHTVNEVFKEEGAYKVCQQALLLALLCAGSDICDSVLY